MSSDLQHPSDGFGLMTDPVQSFTAWRPEPSGTLGAGVVSAPSGSEDLETGSWYCLRCRRNQEALTASQLRRSLGVPVFCPRIRFKQVPGKQEEWANESLFPGYFFAKFDSERVLDEALATGAVSDVIKLDGRYAVVSEELIKELKEQTRATEIGASASALVPGKRWRVLDDIVSGLEVVIVQILPANERIELFLEFLQRKTGSGFGDDNLCPPIFRGSSLLEFTARLGVQSARRGVRRVSKPGQVMGKEVKDTQSLVAVRI